MSSSWDDKYARLRKRFATRHPPPYRNEETFMVPPYLKWVNPCMYTAQTVSLGLNSTRLEPGIEHYKAEFQRCFLKWKIGATSPSACQNNAEKIARRAAIPPAYERNTEICYYNPNLVDDCCPDLGNTWDLFIEDLALDMDVRTAYRWYEIDTSPVNPIILKTFLALDALFLVLFLRYSYQTHAGTHAYPPLPEMLYRELHTQALYRLLAESRSGIWRDVFLLENQIPLHILSKVWILMPDMENRKKEEADDLFNNLLRTVVTDRYLQLFQSDSNGEMVVTKALQGKWFLDCDHLLDCFHYVVCYSPPDDIHKAPPLADEKALAPANTIPSAVQLREVGIHLNSDGCVFVHQTKFVDNFWDGAVLHLPKLCISDQTESLLRNLAVFEMVSCHQYPYRPRVGPRLFTVTSFLILMDKLIQSKKDVELLRKDDIIINCLGSNDEMCHMWNTLC
ncbi:unnamed protein product [Calypogeia fissa]